MTLEEVSEGQVVVKSLWGGFGQRRKLLSLGIYPGEKIRVIQNSAFGGPVLLEVRGVEVAIGRGVARKVEVENLKK